MYTTLKILIRNHLTLKTLLLSYTLKTENNLSVHLKNHQLNLVSTNKKLKFYSILKNEAKYSEFINHIRNLEHKRIASKFRIGNHNLNVETGRFTILKTPKQDVPFLFTWSLISLYFIPIYLLLNCVVEIIFVPVSIADVISACSSPWISIVDGCKAQKTNQSLIIWHYY